MWWPYLSSLSLTLSMYIIQSSLIISQLNTSEAVQAMADNAFEI